MTLIKTSAFQWSQKKKEAGNSFEEITTDNFPVMGEETDFQIQESQRIPNNMNPKAAMPMQMIKMSKVKGTIFLKQQEKKKLFCVKETP